MARETTGATLRVLQEAQRQMGLEEVSARGAADLVALAGSRSDSMRIIAFLLEPPVIKRILSHLGEPATAPTMLPMIPGIASTHSGARTAG